MKHDVEASELRIARFVRIVVFTSAAVIFIGLALYLITGASGYENGAYPIKLAHILTGSAALKPYAIIMLGIILLILTPVLRVAVSVIAFLKEKDFLYVGITALVLIILLISLVIGITG